MSRCATWDRRPRLAALKELAPALGDVALVNVRSDSDVLSIVCIAKPDARQLASWKRKAHLPLAVTEP